MAAILLGSISTVADTSEIQREAFNQAFRDHGLGWRWERADYLAMVEKSGGRARIADYARSVGATVDAAAIHRTKSVLFQKTLATARVSPRPGVAETIRDARGRGVKVGLVTTTSADNVSALLDAVSTEIHADDFDVIVDASDVERPKPDGDAYLFALRTLGEEPGDCVAVEDNVGGARAATAAGLTCVAFPNENTTGHDFTTAVRRVDRLDLDDLRPGPRGE